MKQSLQLRIGQHLAMTPQLQQAIRLLQLSTLELQTEILQALESNPMLEETTDDEVDQEQEREQQAESNENGEQQIEEATGADAGLDLEQERIPDELPTDSQWEDTYQTTSPATSAPPDGEGLDFESRSSAEQTLRDHLTWQMELTPFSDRDRVIATAIIDAVQDDGYLSQTAEEIRVSLPGSGTDPDDPDVELDEVLAVLNRVQQFDPVGVAAHDLGECLRLQLNAMDANTPWRKEALVLATKHLDLLAKRDFVQLKRRMRLNEDALRQVIELVQSLNPRPGADFTPASTEYITPDVYVFKRKGHWQVQLHGDASPPLRINQTYAALVRRADNSPDNTYLKNNLQEARWFLKSLQSRNETLLKVASAIVERQTGFLEEGEEAMQALVLHDIADTLEMHESTISRVTTRKYIHTPRGIFELKYFFSSHVNTAQGGECSSTAIRALIKKMIAAEFPSKPLSDSKIAKTLEEQGIKVARRTVAKYREALHLPPSNERKRLA